MPIYFKLSPELYDGQSSVYTDKQGALELFQMWLEEFQEYPGDCSIESVEMTEREFNALPEV